MKVCLIYPPSCDPTSPYLSLPTLSAFLRLHGLEVTSIDANLEAYSQLLTPIALTSLAERLQQRLVRLERKPALDHRQQLLYSQLWAARGAAAFVPTAVKEALAVLRDSSSQGFYNAFQYTKAVDVIEGALALISAAYAPLSMTFSSYRTPFSLLNLEEIQKDSQAEQNPFHAYLSGELTERIINEGYGLIGISAVFPGQIQSAYTLGYLLRQTRPNIHLTIGGPAITQLLINTKGLSQQDSLGPFDSAILFEGEEALLQLIQRLEKGEKTSGLIYGHFCSDLSQLPAPDFDGLPLEQYLSPEPVLPYDPTRGCYWGKCAFCRYGLTERGTTLYRERPVKQIIEHLKLLHQRYAARIIYFSEDTISPKLALKIAQAIKEEDLPIRWATDIRAEAALTAEACEKLKDGGALCLTLGVESGSARVLKLMDKGIEAKTIKKVLQNAAKAGLAVEAMCFTEFPTETYDEAMLTIQLLEEIFESISLFICGEFELVQGCRVALNPQQYGIKEIWQVAGDQFGTGIFFKGYKASKTTKDKDKLDQAIKMLSSHYLLRSYPWAGSLSTPHTFLWYDQFGPQAFKKHINKPIIWQGQTRVNQARFHVTRVAEESLEKEAKIWNLLIEQERQVSRQIYQKYAKTLPTARPCPRRWRFSFGQDPKPLK